MTKLESIFHVLATRFDVVLRLTTVETHAPKGLIGNRNARDVRHTFGNQQALIVAPLALSAPCQRHGNQQFDAFKKAFGSEFAGHHFAQQPSDVGLMMVFQGIDGASGGRTGRIIEPCGGLSNGHLLPIEAAKWVVERCKNMVGTGQMTVACAANCLLGTSQPIAADGAHTRCYEVDEAVPEINHRAVGLRRHIV